MNETPARNNHIRHLGILQYNLNKNQTTQHSLLNSPSTANYAALLIQEPYYSKLTNSTIIHHSWTLIEGHKRERNHTVIYVNKKLISAASYEPVNIPFSDITAISITSQESINPTLIVNIYKAKGNPLTQGVIGYLQRHLQTRHKYSAIIIAGDFNLHHPLWNPTGYLKHD